MSVSQLTVRARDQMNPERSSTATVSINIRGDNQPPQFTNPPYSAEINFNTPVGTSVYQASSTDNDRIVSPCG